jgi:hypothetical protein
MKGAATMTAIAAPTVATTRPSTVTAAAALLALLAALAVPTMILISDGFDPVFFGIGGIFAILKLIAAIGLWRCRRWAAILGFVATLLDVLLSLPGFGDGTFEGGAVLVAIGVILGIIALVLLALPASRRACA